MAVRVLLDGLELDPTTPALDVALFTSLGLPVLGTHTVEVQATDCAANQGTTSVAFELVLFGESGSGLLVVKPESLQVNGGVMTAFFTLPDSVTGDPLDPTFEDVMHATLLLEAVATGRQAAPESVTVSENKLVLKFRREDLALDDGTIGTTFRLTGRFFTTTGPAFVAEDEVKKNP